MVEIRDISLTAKWTGPGLGAAVPAFCVIVTVEASANGEAYHCATYFPEEQWPAFVDDQAAKMGKVLADGLAQIERTALAGEHPDE